MGGTEDSWYDENVTEFDNDVTVRLRLKDEVSEQLNGNEELTVIRDHDGNKEVKDFFHIGLCV